MKLIYLSHTRLDIAYVVSLVSQFMHNPGEEHMQAVTRILQYLKASPGKGIMFRKNKHVQLYGYMDADWARNITDRNSTSSYFTFFGGNLVTWRSKKQRWLYYLVMRLSFVALLKDFVNFYVKNPRSKLIIQQSHL